MLKTIKVEIPSIATVSSKDVTTEELIQCPAIQNIYYKTHDLEHIPSDVRRKLNIFLKRIYKFI